MGLSSDAVEEIRCALQRVRHAERILNDLIVVSQTYPVIHRDFHGFRLGPLERAEVDQLQRMVRALDDVWSAVTSVDRETHARIVGGFLLEGVPADFDAWVSEMRFIWGVLGLRLARLRSHRPDQSALVPRRPRITRRGRAVDQARYTLATVVAYAFARNGVKPTTWRGANRSAKTGESPYLKVLRVMVRELLQTNVESLRETARAATVELEYMKRYPDQFELDVIFQPFFRPDVHGPGNSVGTKSN